MHIQVQVRSWSGPGVKLMDHVAAGPSSPRPSPQFMPPRTTSPKASRWGTSIGVGNQRERPGSPMRRCSGGCPTMGATLPRSASCGRIRPAPRAEPRWLPFGVVVMTEERRAGPQNPINPNSTPDRTGVESGRMQHKSPAGVHRHRKCPPEGGPSGHQIVRSGGFEPPAFGTGNRCSVRLSYERRV